MRLIWQFAMLFVYIPIVNQANGTVAMKFVPSF